MTDSDPLRDPLSSGARSVVPPLLVAFFEWRRRCALAACSPASTGLLRYFGHTRFDAFCRRYAPFPSPRVPHPVTPAAADCWHLFETHLAVDQTRSGKRYKQWLFEAARTAEGLSLDRLTGGASLLMRDVVRAWLLHEAPEPDTRSLQAPLGWDTQGGPLMLEHLLPAGDDPAGEAAGRELARIAETESTRRWRRLDPFDRRLLAARARGLSLADPAVVRKIGRRKSVLYAQLRSLLQRLADGLRRDYADEDPPAVAALAQLTLQALRRRALRSRFSEKRPARTFSRGKGRIPSKAARTPARRKRAEGHAS